MRTSLRFIVVIVVIVAVPVPNGSLYESHPCAPSTKNASANASVDEERAFCDSNCLYCAIRWHVEDSPRRPWRSDHESNLLQLPRASSEQHGAPRCHHAERDRYGDEDTVRTEPKDAREHPCKRDLQTPEAKEVELGGCPSIAGAVERGTHAHAGCVKRKPETDD